MSSILSIEKCQEVKEGIFVDVDIWQFFLSVYIQYVIILISLDLKEEQVKETEFYVALEALVFYSKHSVSTVLAHHIEVLLLNLPSFLSETVYL